MSYQEIYHGLMAGIENMTWMEGLAVGFAIISVLCARSNSIWVYPTGIAGILLSKKPPHGKPSASRRCSAR